MTQTTAKGTTTTPHPVCAKESLDLLNCIAAEPFDREKCVRFLDALRSCVLEKVIPPCTLFRLFVDSVGICVFYILDFSECGVEKLKLVLEITQRKRRFQNSIPFWIMFMLKDKRNLMIFWIHILSSLFISPFDVIETWKHDGGWGALSLLIWQKKI